MIEVTADPHWIVVHTVAIQDHAATARHAAEELRNIEMPDSHQAVTIDPFFLFISAREQIQIPFEHENYSVCRFQIERALERRARLIRRVDYNIMSQRFGDACISKDVLRAAGISDAPIHKHHSHRTTVITLAALLKYDAIL